MISFQKRPSLATKEPCRCFGKTLDLFLPICIIHRVRNKLRLFAILALAFLALLGGFVWWSMPPKEPTYKGKPLSFWLEGYDWQRGILGSPKPTRTEADAAVHAIGTNGIPTLLRMLQKHNRLPFALEFYRWVNTQRFHKVNWEYRFPEEDGHDAMLAFHELGLNTGNILEELTRIYDSNPHTMSRQFVVAVASSTSTNAQDCLPLFLRALKDTNDFFVRADAAVALAKIHAPADVAVPALINSLKDPELMVRTEAIYSLAEYGAEAREALPELKKIIADEIARANGYTNVGPSTRGWLAWGFSFGDAHARRPVNPFQCDILRTARDSVSRIQKSTSGDYLDGNKFWHGPPQTNNPAD